MNNKNFNYVSLDVIANKIYKNPLLKDVNYEDIIDFALSVIKIAKVPGVYVEESCYKDVVDYKAAIPKNALNIKTVDYCSGDSLTSMVKSSDSLSKQVDKIRTGRYNDQFTKQTYNINNQIIKTSFCDGKIFITFDTIKVDDDNIPMIPDSEALLRAVEAYIKMQVYTILVDLGKLSERALNRVEQEYYFNIGKVQTEFQGFNNEDDMESFINGFKRTFISDDSHDTRYSGESQRQNIRRL